MFCSNCGQQVHDQAVVCVHCGCAVANRSAVAPQAHNPYDAPDAGFAVLGFFIPVIGLILYLTNKDTSPLKAKSAGKGALIGFCVGMGLSILYTIFFVIVYGSLLSSFY